MVGSSKVTFKAVLHQNKSTGMKGTYESMSLIMNAAFTSAFFLKTSVLLVQKEEKCFINVCIYIVQQISITVTCFSSKTIIKKLSYFTSQGFLRMSRPNTDLILFLFSEQSCVSIQFFCPVIYPVCLNSFLIDKQFFYLEP